MPEIMISPDVMWVLICSFLVAVMQAGFACLETGFVRSKNSINVAVKNLVDFCVCSVIFTFFGYRLMFGDSNFGIIGEFGYIDLDVQSGTDVSFYIFQLMFAGTAATIISGAVAERMKFTGYIIITFIMAGFIYPVYGHWVWSEGGWLGRFGFVDFAGSTVVHGVAGWCSLAAVRIIGPRIGRFGRHGKPIEGHNLPVAVLGVFLLWFGFFGFNGGSTLAFNESVPRIIANTTLAGAASGCGALMVSWIMYRIPKVEHLVNGVVAGLVAICAGCNLFDEKWGFVVGFTAGILCVLAMKALEKMKVDDVIGAVPAHLVAGVWGTLAVAFFAPIESFPLAMSRFEQFVIQFVGVAAAGLYSYFILYFAMRILSRWVAFRVSPQSEKIGLNISEHGASSSLLDLINQMNFQAGSGDFSKPVEIEPETEAGHIATFYNTVLEKFQTESARREKAVDELYKLANYDALTSLVNRRYFTDLTDKAVRRVKRTGGKIALMYLDLDGFKMVNDTLGHDAGDELLVLVAEKMQDILRESDVIGRIGGDEFCILAENFDTEKDLHILAKKIIKTVSATHELKAAKVNIGVSIGISVFNGADGGELSTDKLLKEADNAMYSVKSGSKGSYRFFQNGDGRAE
jgi:Amt family ammonium transporter